MIDFYDPNIHFATHTVRVTFMDWSYVGHVAFEIGGNCKGGNILDPDHFEDIGPDDIERFVENDCNMQVEDDDQYFYLQLTDPADGEALDWDGDADELKDIIVGMEIIRHKEATIGTEK